MKNQPEKVEHIDKNGAFYIQIMTGTKLKGWCIEGGMLPRTTEDGLAYIGDKPGSEVRGFNQLGLDGIVLQVTDFQGSLSLKESNKVNSLEGSTLKLIIPTRNEKAELSVALFDETVQRPEPITEDLMITYDCARKEKSGSFRVISEETANAWQQSLCLALCDSLISSSITAAEKREYFAGLPTFHNLLNSYNQLAPLEARMDTLNKDETTIRKTIEKLEGQLTEIAAEKINIADEFREEYESVGPESFQKTFVRPNYGGLCQSHNEEK